MSRQRTYNLWGRGDWGVTTHFFSLMSSEQLFDSMCNQCLKKAGRGGGNINGKAVFQHLYLFYFRCVLLGKMLLWCEKVPKNLKPFEVRKVKTQYNFWTGDSKQSRVWTSKILTGKGAGGKTGRLRRWKLFNIKDQSWTKKQWKMSLPYWPGQ